MGKISLNSSLTMTEAFDNFIFAKSAQGLTDKTLKSYQSHFKCISNYLDTTIKLNSLAMMFQMVLRWLKVSTMTILAGGRTIKKEIKNGSHYQSINNN